MQSRPTGYWPRVPDRRPHGPGGSDSAWPKDPVLFAASRPKAWDYEYVQSASSDLFRPGADTCPDAPPAERSNSTAHDPAQAVPGKEPRTRADSDSRSPAHTLTTI